MAEYLRLLQGLYATRVGQYGAEAQAGLGAAQLAQQQRMAQQQQQQQMFGGLGSMGMQLALMPFTGGMSMLPGMMGGLG